MELKTYGAIVWRRKWVIALTAAVTVAMVAVGTLMLTPQYEASTTLRIVPIADTLGNERLGWSDLQYGDRLMKTYSEIVTSNPLQAELAQRLNLERPPQVEVEIPANTELMRIVVEHPRPPVAAAAANTLAEILITRVNDSYTEGGKTALEILGEQLARLEMELNQARQAYENQVAQSSQDSEQIETARRAIAVKQETYATVLEQYEQARVTNALRANTIAIIEPAAVPQTPSKPLWKFNLALGLLVGLAGGLGLAFLFENVDTALYTTQQIEAVTKLSTLGRIPTNRTEHLNAFSNNPSPQGEAFRRLRTNIFSLEAERQIRILMVTSAELGEGKSTIVANLAHAMAQSGQKVVVVDCDFRRPTLHKIFNLPNNLGLSNILTQEMSLAEAGQTHPATGIHVLTSGPLPPNPAELLGSAQMTTLLEQLSHEFDRVILDSPAYLRVTDVAILSPAVDAVALVVRRAKTRQEALQAIQQQMHTLKTSIIGVVVNEAEPDGKYDGYYQLKDSPTLYSTMPKTAMTWLTRLSSRPVILPRVGPFAITLFLSVVALVGFGAYLQLNPAEASLSVTVSSTQKATTLGQPDTTADQTQLQATQTVDAIRVETEEATVPVKTSPSVTPAPAGASQTPKSTPTATPTPYSPTATPTPTTTPTTAPVTTVASEPASVVFVQSSGQSHELTLVASDGRLIKNLHPHAAAPAWSPDAAKIAFYGELSISGMGGIYQQGSGVWLIDPWQNKEPSLLVKVDYIDSLAWSPDGTKLALEVKPPAENSFVVVIDAKNGQEISRFPGEQPGWTPDSQKLTIKACYPECGLWLVNFDGRDGAQITLDGTDSFPVWSPTGQYLVFSSFNRDNDWEIYRLKMNGNQPAGEPQRLTQRPGVDTTPVFGPDGRELFLRTNAYGGWRITAMGLEGGNERLVKEGVGESDSWGLARPSVH
jgi:non-specific protein-tyrosine kinase